MTDKKQDRVLSTSIAVVARDPVVLKLETARAALVQATDLSEVKHIHDVAAAGEIYARRQQLGEEAIGYAHAVKIEALARLGELLRGIPKRGTKHSRGGGSKGSSRVPLPDAPPLLADLGITKKLSAVAQQLAALPEETREAIASRETTLTKAVQAARHAERRETPPLPANGKYRVLYADPPWHYGNSGLQNYGHASHHYPPMTIAELSALPVANLVEPDAVLFLWVTSPLLEACFAVIAAWGFTYKTSFIWDKVHHNFGHYNSVRHELLLVCTRGHCTPDVPTLYDSVWTINRTKTHSEKPDEFRAIIDAIYPNGARLELFARKEHAGWAVWGNEPV